MPRYTRRQFIRRTAVTAGGTLLGTAALSGLVARATRTGAGGGREQSQAARGEGGYGPLRPAGPELALPDGFTYRTLGVEGSVMSDGHQTPKAHDGMAAFALPNGNIRLMRNHEDRDSAASATLKGDPAKAYDPSGGGGVSSLEIAPTGERGLVRDFMSLSGTIVNCAGGPTPWETWLSCEEATEGEIHGWGKDHGYVYEVSALAEEEIKPVPLKAMGRFVHEAVAVDPRTGIIYETEDRGTAGFYRFLPNEPGKLAAGGILQMLAIAGQPNLNAAEGQRMDVHLPVIWVDIDDPDPAEAETNDLAVFLQGYAKGGARFSRLEGCWYGDGSIFFHATDGGDAGLGQIWQYVPHGNSGGTLSLLFESPSPDVLDGPDNITVSPRGGIVICEDGGGENYLRGLTPDGKIFDFARNLVHDGEFAGACFSPDGQTLFINIQGDTRAGGAGRLGMTFAIWGPWQTGAL